MELKTKFQYTYFIYPYMVKKTRYTRYIQKLLRNTRCTMRIFEKTKDAGIYSYFNPKIRNYMFSTFNFNKAKIKKLDELSEDTKAAILSKMPCIVFEYNLSKDIQGKTDMQDGIFFKIQKLEIICFNTGICFLSIKTNVEDSESFSDILNFNYKFRSINSGEVLTDFDNVKIQTDSFEDIKTFRNFISDLTGTNLLEVNNIDIDTQKFLTFGYVCIDQSNWGDVYQFDTIKSNYIKYLKILPNDNNVTYSSDMKIIEKWNYAKLGITKQGVTLFTSSIDINNYTILPHEYENQYLYTYILALYIKIYLKVINLEFKTGNNVNKTRKKFIEFTKNIWIQEITNDDIGTLYYNTLAETLELDNLYSELKNKYDILYKELNIEKNMKVNAIIVIILGISLIFNVLNYVALLRG